VSVRLVLLIAAASWLLLLGSVGFFLVSGAERDDRFDSFQAQICQQNRDDITDLRKRYRQTVEYLKSPVGQEKTGLNDYIRRISFPRLKQDVRSAELPPACR
jgi:hypothetical protein